MSRKLFSSLGRSREYRGRQEVGELAAGQTLLPRVTLGESSYPPVSVSDIQKRYKDSTKNFFFPGPSESNGQNGAHHSIALFVYFFFSNRPFACTTKAQPSKL